MPRTCRACKSSQRQEIDAAIVAGTSFRNIAKRFGTTAGAVFRHKTHAAQAIVKASERREEQIGDNMLDQMRRAQRKAWALLDKAEAEGDVRGAIVALREARECIESLGEMLSRATAGQGGNTNLAALMLERIRRLREASESSAIPEPAPATPLIAAAIEAAPDHVDDAGKRCEESRPSLPRPARTFADVPASPPKLEPDHGRVRLPEAGDLGWMAR
jgi:hypothetical protein